MSACLTRCLFSFDSVPSAHSRHRVASAGWGDHPHGCRSFASVGVLVVAGCSGSTAIPTSSSPPVKTVASGQDLGQSQNWAY